MFNKFSSQFRSHISSSWNLCMTLVIHRCFQEWHGKISVIWASCILLCLETMIRF
uniref:Uncharacterized protein n=1 Tax=Arundo donax TaxID=35708 RepID=A0A0A9G6D3_ARUDO